NSIINGLCKLGRWEEASMMLKEMEDERISPNCQTFSILVDAFCKKGMVEEAEAIIDTMVERGLVPTIVTYNTLVDGYCLPGEISKAKTVFDLLTFKGLVSDAVTYSSLLNGYCKNLKIEEAMNMFREMTRKGLKPDIVTYNTMLQGLYRVGRCGDARKLFDEMRSQGASKRGKLDIARALFQNLTVKGLQSNVRTYNVMINALCGEGLLKEAKNLFLKMDESGCPPDNVTYRVLLQGYLKSQRYDDVEMLLQEMDGRSYSLDDSNVSLLIDKIAAGSLNRSMLKLIGRLGPKELLDTPS
ncbi:uncharacterized protein LOC143600583, partial [Bidens hawaiensis]|uniref:uncharacterized protein LOC143600583 n=1 Tax=Bidens hawaiensis TaxID=980011 RepID=UPI00404B83E9